MTFFSEREKVVIPFRGNDIEFSNVTMIYDGGGWHLSKDEVSALILACQKNLLMDDQDLDLIKRFEMCSRFGYGYCEQGGIDCKDFYSETYPSVPELEDCSKDIPVSPDGFVYVLKAVGSDAFYKIGVSKEIPTRMKTLQRQSPYKLKLFCSIYTESMYSLETAIHQIFSKKRFEGEWFQFSEQDLVLLQGIVAAHGGSYDRP